MAKVEKQEKVRSGNRPARIRRIVDGSVYKVINELEVGQSAATATVLPFDEMIDIAVEVTQEINKTRSNFTSNITRVTDVYPKREYKVATYKLMTADCLTVTCVGVVTRVS